MAKLALCVSVVLVLLVALSDGSPVCCTQYQETPVSVRHLKYYRVQDITHHCNIKAIIFKTVKNRLFCADPNRKWVKNAMKSVPEKP